MKVFILTGTYIPGYKAGGPIRSIANIIAHLGDEYEFYIVTSDRDLGDTEPYRGIEFNKWTVVGKSEVIYLKPEDYTISGIIRLLHKTDYDILYLNSFFARWCSMIPVLCRYARLIPRKPVIIAPRGEFSMGALAIRSLRKKLYIGVARFLGLYRDVLWHASTPYEVQDIEYQFGRSLKAHVAGNLPAFISDKQKTARIIKTKEKGYIDIVFISRISRKKNLSMALRAFNQIEGKVTFNIYGPCEDILYWDECQKIIDKLPPNIKVHYHGPIEHTRVGAIFADSHLFFFPTLGENFGHVILESLSHGCPVLISDQTPWRGLESLGIGCDITLDDKENYRVALQKYIDMGQEEYNLLSARAYEYGSSKLNDPEVVEQNRQLFIKAFNGKN